MDLIGVSWIDHFPLAAIRSLTLVEAVPIMVDQRTASTGEVVLFEDGDLETSLGESRGRCDATNTSACDT